MTPQEIEDLLIRSLDAPLTTAEAALFSSQLKENASLEKDLSDHKKIRELLRPAVPASFGYFFASKLIAHIENTGVVIERQIFAFFKKYQLLAAGVIVALLILNTVFSEQPSMNSIFGLENTTTPADEIVSFDFYKTLNTDL